MLPASTNVTMSLVLSLPSSQHESEEISFSTQTEHDKTATDAPIPTLAITTTGKKPSRSEQRSKFDDKKIYDPCAESAGSESKCITKRRNKTRCKIGALHANATVKFTFAVTRKSGQNQYKRLQSHFDTRALEDSHMSGIGSEVGEVEELLSSMTETRGYKEREVLEKKRMVRDREAEKEHPG